MALVRTRGDEIGRRRRLVHEIPVAILANCRDERVGDGDGDVEVRQAAVVLRVHERLDVRMIAAQDAHLRAAARARRFDGLAALVEHTHVSNTIKSWKLASSENERKTSFLLAEPVMRPRRRASRDNMPLRSPRSRS